MVQFGQRRRNEVIESNAVAVTSNRTTTIIIKCWAFCKGKLEECVWMCKFPHRFATFFMQFTMIDDRSFRGDHRYRVYTFLPATFHNSCDKGRAAAHKRVICTWVIRSLLNCIARLSWVRHASRFPRISKWTDDDDDVTLHRATDDQHNSN